MRREVEEADRRYQTTANQARDYQKDARGLALPDTLSVSAVRDNVEHAKSVLVDLPSQIEDAKNAFGESRGVLSGITTEIKNLSAQITEIEKRPNSNIDAGYQRLRDEIVDSLQLDKDQIVFVGELLDVRNTELAWRGAIERALGGHRTTLLVPEEKYRMVTGWVNRKQTGLHVRIQVVSKSERNPEFLGDGFLRKLEWKEHPYRDWLESNMPLLAALLDVRHKGALGATGGLEAWLCCLPTPNNWIYVRPLCPEVRQQMGGFSVLQIPLEQLLEQPLPGSRVLVVENTKPGYALPELPDTVAIFGGGRNTQWRNALWLSEREVAYWGGLDSWGLTILAEARQSLPKLTALMMDSETLMAHIDFAVEEPCSTALPVVGLLEEERALFEGLNQSSQSIIRLEQEYIAQDYVLSKLYAWIQSSVKNSLDCQVIDLM